MGFLDSVSNFFEDVSKEIKTGLESLDIKLSETKYTCPYCKSVFKANKEQPKKCPNCGNTNIEQSK